MSRPLGRLLLLTTFLLACDDRRATLERDEHVQRFSFPPLQPVDLLFLVGNTPGMGPAHEALVAELPRLADRLQEDGRSARFALVVVDDFEGCRFRISDGPELAIWCLQNMGVPGTPQDELAVLHDALACDGLISDALIPCGGDLFLRPEAALGVVFVTEATCERPEHVTIDDVYQRLLDQKPEPLTSIQVLSFGGCRSGALAERFGEAGHACTSGLEPCPDIAEVMSRHFFQSFDVRAHICLDHAPAPGSVRVEVNAVRSDDWRVQEDAECPSGFAVVDGEPPWGAQVVIRFQLR